MLTDSTSVDATVRLEQLKDLGAHRYDPVRFHYLESLTRRLQDKSAGNHRHGERLDQAITDFGTAFAEARTGAEAALERARSQSPEQGDHQALTSMLANGEFKALMRQLEQRQQDARPSPLATLFQAIQARASAPVDTDDSPLDELWQTLVETPTPAADGPVQPRRELKAMGELRAIQARQAMERLIDEAIARTPEDAGPMNPHRMVTRAIKLMRTLSPEYLHHFAGYVDTLVWLERMGRKG